MLNTPSPVNPELIALLEQHLAAAKAGHIVAVGIVALTPTGTIDLMSCGEVAPLSVGAAQLQRQLLDALFPKAMEPSRFQLGGHTGGAFGKLSS